MAQLSVAVATARTLLNDDVSNQFTDAVIIPKAQEAHRELQEELWICGSPVVRAQSLQDYTIGNTQLDAVPADMLCPTALFENAAASTLLTQGWAPMTEAMYIPPGTQQGPTLNFWCWMQEQLLFAGASAARKVLIQYRRSIPVPVLITDQIGILSGELYIAARSAALVAGTLGNAEVFAALTAEAKDKLAKVIAANRGQQKSPMRP